VDGVIGAIAQGRSFGMTFPPFVALEIGDTCVTLAPLPCGHDVVAVERDTQGPQAGPK
jgi:hypothetical protein